MASIHTLHPPQGSDGASRGAVPPPPHPLIAALRQLAFPALGELLRKMFGRADDALFEMGERAQSDIDRRHYFDTVRVLRLEQARILGRFNEALAARFDEPPDSPAPMPGTAIDLDELAIQPADELEERIAVTNLVARAEGMHRQLVYELERRMSLAVRQLHLPLSPQALSPSRICEAFASSIRPLDSDFQIKLIVFKLFEREIIRDLHGIYERVLALLDQHAPLAPASVASRASAAAASVAAATAAADPRMLDLLKREVAREGATSADGHLAEELARTLQHAEPAIRGGGDAAASLQRLSLANQFFDQLLAEPLLPETARPMLERLRFPVIKTALSDPGFFAGPEHPLRSLLGELVDLAVGGAIGEAVAPKAFGDSVARVADQADIDAQMVRSALSGLHPLDSGELDHFISGLREQERSRRAMLLSRVRRLVAQELEVQTLGREVPDPAQTLLRSGIGPLLAVRLLKHGRSSTPYRDAHELLQRILGSLEANNDAASTAETLESLCRSIDEALTGIGMRRERIDALLAGLREAHAALTGAEPAAASQAAPAPTAAAAEMPAAPSPSAAATAAADPAGRLDLAPITIVELLDRILIQGNWYRVYDAEHRTTRWLKLAAYFPHQDSIGFSGFDEGIKLSLRAQRFALDLAEGRSEPINPDPGATAALESLKRAKVSH